MKAAVHIAAAYVSTALIAAFLAATLGAELFGGGASIALIKGWIVNPGLGVLVPALALTGASGFALSRTRRGRLVEAKKKRMPVIAANGLLVLVPCALVLELWASRGTFDAAFYAVQSLELAAGAINLFLMGLNFRDGLRLRSLQLQHAAS